jgi:hypothetical protein
MRLHLQGDYSKKLFNQSWPKKTGNQNFSFLAFKGEAVGMTQIPSHNGA